MFPWAPHHGMALFIYASGSSHGQTLPRVKMGLITIQGLEGPYIHRASGGCACVVLALALFPRGSSALAPIPPMPTILIFIKVAISGCTVNFYCFALFWKGDVEWQNGCGLAFLLNSWDVKRNKLTGMHVKSELQGRHLLLFLFGSWFEGLMFRAFVRSSRLQCA